MRAATRRALAMVKLKTSGKAPQKIAQPREGGTRTVAEGDITSIAERVAAWLKRKPRLYVHFHPLTAVWCLANENVQPVMQVMFTADFTQDGHREALVIVNACPRKSKSWYLAQLKAYSKGPYALLKNPVGTAFTYDSQGRVTQKRERNVLFEETTTISYNEHGDEARERKTVKENSILPRGPSYSFSFDADGNPVISNSAPEHPARPERDYLPPDSDIRCAYQYDSYGNWTERTETRAEGSSAVTRRMLTYY